MSWENEQEGWTMATTTNEMSGYDQHDAGASPEMVRAHMTAWNNFRRLILGVGCAAMLALGVLWWITY